MKPKDKVSDMDYTKNNYSYAKDTASYDAGLRSYMLTVYNYMAGALGLTGLVAFMLSQSPALMNLIFGTPLYFVALFAPLVMVFIFARNIMNYSFSTVQMMFWAFAALMGVSLSSIFIQYTGESIARAFFITAGTFGAMSLYGYTTKKDLSGWGSFLIMGLIGIIIASLVNIFLKSSAIQMAVTYISVFIFIGLTAYDTQNIKRTYYQVSGSAEMAARMAIYGALQLYMDFINLLISLIQIFGERR